ncbi:MAG TPA: hypothetical protein VGH91_10635 [Gammaproteobacteria bacterium]|jgi:hypothetical protein
MAAKKRSTFGPKVRLLLEQALLEALKRHIGGQSRPKKKAPAPKKKVGKKKPAHRPAKKRSRKVTSRRKHR